jgi:hypothetical protein
MQTEIIQATRQFREFEKNFSHFFSECERGFINEVIISLYARVYHSGKQIIAYKQNVKEMYFVRKGLVEVFNNSKDEMYVGKPVLYLPKYSYFGDWQILHSLKSNLIYKTFTELTKRDKKQENLTRKQTLKDLI